MNRYIGWEDKNKNKIYDSAVLSEFLENMDLENPRNNWEKLLLNAKEKGAKKVIVSLVSQKPHLRIKYNIKFEPNVDIDDYDKPFNETFHDAFFLSYICDSLVLENKLEDNELEFLNWKDSHSFDLKFKNQSICLWKEYIVNNLEKKFYPKDLPPNGDCLYNFLKEVFKVHEDK